MVETAFSPSTEFFFFYPTPFATHDDCVKHHMKDQESFTGSCLAEIVNFLGRCSKSWWTGQTFTTTATSSFASQNVYNKRGDS